ncbi:MAG: ABC transporter substrate-binding protein [Desulfobacteraceae bacterium]|nr:ABC transporter substrate-binding protein [Desulfobacteraceae bacterium]
MLKKVISIISILQIIFLLQGCSPDIPREKKIPVKDQLGRVVMIPEKVERIAALHHFGGKIIHALGQQDKMVCQGILGREALALEKVDQKFAAIPKQLRSSTINVEGLISLRPQVIFIYASRDEAAIELFENAGISVFAITGETLAESFQAVKILGKVLNCEDAANRYLNECRGLLDMVHDRLGDLPPEERVRVMFSGPKSVYSVATGHMLQDQMLGHASADNVAAALPGYWATVSPEQISAWNPDVIFLGSSLDLYEEDRIFNNPHFKTVKAIKNKRVYSFPSNIGWWDYPAPNCVLGIVWSAKTLYPDRFRDIDMTALADGFYTRYVGHSFTSMGGKL